MTIEKRGNKYRIRKMYKGKYYSVTLDHKPSEKEAIILMSEAMQDLDVPAKGTVRSCIDGYIASKSNVLSPGTIRGYRTIQRNAPEWFLNLNISDVSQVELQRAINEYTTNHSPKSVRNLHALMVATIKMYRPNLNFNTTLPQREAKEPSIPEHNDIIRLLEAMKDDDLYPCIVLGCLGLRRSEVFALEPSDFSDNGVLINKARVANEHGKFVVKGTKTTDSTRFIFVPSEIIDIIRKRGYVYNRGADALIRTMHRYQDAIGMPRCRFHDLRHFYVSYAHSIGMSDAAIQKAGGWATDSCMKKVYRHSMNDAEEQKRVANSMLNALG